MDIAFGFQYRIDGLPEQVIYDFDLRVTHPPMLLPNGRLHSFYKTVIQKQAEHGKIQSSVVYTIKNEFEKALGVWTLELLYQDKALLSRQFIME